MLFFTSFFQYEILPFNTKQKNKTKFSDHFCKNIFIWRAKRAQYSETIKREWLKPTRERREAAEGERSERS